MKVKESILFLSLAVLIPLVPVSAEAQQKRSQEAIQKVGRPNEANIRILIEKLQKDPAFRKKAISLMKVSIYEFAEQVFDLTDEERKEMREFMPEEMAKVVGPSLISTLETGGKIKFAIPGAIRPCSVVLQCTLDPFTGELTCSIGIECPIDP